MARSAEKAPRAEAPSMKDTRFTQNEMPKYTLERALSIPSALVENFGSKPVAPHFVADAIDLSPTSSNWRLLSGAAIAYGLTDGGYNAANIGLTSLGRRILAPTQEGDDRKALVDAALTPRVSRQFFERYNRNKFPPEKIALSVLQHELSVPHDRVQEAYQVLLANGKFTGIIMETKTGLFVSLEAPDGAKRPTVVLEAAPEPENGEEDENHSPLVAPASTPTPTPANTRVFIAHGKNKQVVNQLKDLLTFGKLTPVVAEETETTSKPIPEKVLGDMRSCFAGILHVASEEELLDKSGEKHHKLNENVLIEIGAAMALYGKNLILLAQKGLHLPSNLQGLYVCYYEGEKLDYEATMKLLKAFNEFQKDSA